MGLMVWLAGIWLTEGITGKTYYLFWPFYLGVWIKEQKQ